MTHYSHTKLRQMINILKAAHPGNRLSNASCIAKEPCKVCNFKNFPTIASVPLSF